MFLHPYDTTPCKGYLIEKVEQKLKELLISGRRVPMQTIGERIIDNAYLITAEHSTIPPFAHPVCVKDSRDHEHWFVDARGCTRVDREGSLKIINRDEYDHITTRTQLSMHWKYESPQDFLSLGHLPLTVFIRWVSEGIARRMSLEPLVQLRIAIVAGYYYYSLFTRADDFTEDYKVNVAMQISRYTRINTRSIMEIIDRIPHMASIADFARVAGEVSDSLRMEKFSAGLAVSMLAGSWFGPNAKEVVAVGLEHPPTYFTLVSLAVNNNSYRKAALANVVLQNDKQDAGRSFTYNLRNLLKMRER